MSRDERLNRVISEYTTLQQSQQTGALDNVQRRRLETLQDVVLGEASIAEGERNAQLPRPPRAPVSLEVRFKTREDAGRAQSINVGPGGIAVQTARPLPVGTSLKVQLDVPGWRGPIVTDGTVAWTDPRAMGIAFTALRPEDACRLKELVVESGSLIGRLRSALGHKEGPRPASVAGGAGVLLCLPDEFLVDVTSELLGLHGFAAFDTATKQQRVDLVVADVECLARAAVEGANHPIIIANAGGPEDVAGRFHSKNPVAWIPRPASAARIVEAARRMLVSLPGVAATRASSH